MMRCKWSGLVGPWNTQTQQYSFLDVHFGREQAAKQLEEQKRIIERVVESMQSSSQQFKLKLEPTGGTANPLLFTIHLQTEAADGHPAEPVPETAIDLFIYDRANNHLKLKPEFHANGKLIDARSYNQ